MPIFFVIFTITLNNLLYGNYCWREVQFNRVENLLIHNSYYEEVLIGRKFYIDNHFNDRDITFWDVYNCHNSKDYSLATDSFFIHT